MSEHDKQLVRQTWKVLEKDLELHGVNFFLRIFKMEPGVRQIFTFRVPGGYYLPYHAGEPEEEGWLPEDAGPKLKQHAQQYMKMIALAVENLDGGADIRKRFGMLGTIHAKFGVEPEHFALMRHALLLTIEEELAPHSSPEILGAWGRAYDSVAAMMAETMFKEHVRLNEVDCEDDDQVSYASGHLN